MTYIEAEKRAWKETLENDNISPDQAVKEYRRALLRYGYNMDGMVAVKTEGQWGAF